ncbi:MAG: hypothetical protein N2645_02890 [Clostridia bacterium]|nr:hypothetical protein [Clostridia bacterium]
MQKSAVLESTRNTLKKIEAFTINIKDQQLFSNLLSFTAYYYYVIEFYAKNMEHIISVKELLLLKYIDMIKDILENFNEKVAARAQKEELLNTLITINGKLFATITDIKKQEELDLRVDLKTIQDLVRSDF